MGKPTSSYIMFFINRVKLLLHYNIKVMLVFDGARLPAKQGTEEERRTKRVGDRGRQNL